MLRHRFLFLIYISLTLSAAVFLDIDVRAAGTQQIRAYVQVAARNDEQAASRVSAFIKEKYGRIIGDHTISIIKTEIRDTGGGLVMRRGWNDVGKSEWYRVLIGPMAKNEADLLCERLKGAGLKGCFVRPPQQWQRQ
jgi:hypothetical protein